MQSLYESPWFTFHFADDRIVPRIHLNGVAAGQKLSIFKIDALTGERKALLRTTITDDDGWADLVEPIVVRAGEAFIAVVEKQN